MKRSTVKLKGGWDGRSKLEPLVYTFQATNISYLGKRNIIFKYTLGGGYVSFQEGTLILTVTFLHSAGCFDNGCLKFCILKILLNIPPSASSQAAKSTMCTATNLASKEMPKGCEKVSAGFNHLPMSRNREKNPCAPDEITEALLRNSREFSIKAHLSTAVISTTSPTRIYIFQSMFHLCFIQETCWQAVVHSPVLCHPSCASRSVLSLDPWSREASIAFLRVGKIPPTEDDGNPCYIHPNYWVVDEFTLQGINISHLGKRKIIFKLPFLGDMLVPWRVSVYPP